MKKFTPVFIVSFVLTIAFILWGAVAPKNLEAMSSSAQGFLQTNFGWFYLFAASAILIFVIFLAFSRFGDIRLGKDDEEPEYSRFSWFAMLFSAGMGIGLVFWGVAEPISHYYNPPYGEGATAEAAKSSLQYTLFHWAYILGVFIH